MKPVGMCRMCLVEIEGPRGMALQPACMVPCTDGMNVLTESDTVKKAQDGILEFLLINHPLDCPVCDRGGECPLQDQTLAYGPGESRFVEEKRHWAKPIPISELVLLDRERCIQCARCTRFADEIAGDPLIQFGERGNSTEIITFPDDPFTSYFSGNTVQICPVGALTARPYRFRARPWDLDQTESTCTVCAVGCRMALQSSSDRLIRHLGIDIDPVNQGWLCDKGRFSHEAVNSDDRLLQPLVRDGDALARGGRGTRLSARWPTRCAAPATRTARRRSPCWAAPASPTRTRTPGRSWPARCSAPTTSTASSATGFRPRSCSGCPAPRSTTPAAPAPSCCSAPISRKSCPSSTCACARPPSRTVCGSSRSRRRPPGSPASPPPRSATAPARWRRWRAPLSTRARPPRRAASPPPTSPRPALRLPASTTWSSCWAAHRWPSPPASVADAVGVLVDAFPRLRVLPALRRGNVHGALDMGLAPGVLPGRVSAESGRDWFGQEWGALPGDPGLDAAAILNAAAEGRVHGLVLLGADLLTDFPDRALARRALTGAGFVVALDTFLSATAREADVVLPVADVRRARRHHHQPRGPGEPGHPEDHAARAPPAATG